LRLSERELEVAAPRRFRLCDGASRGALCSRPSFQRACESEGGHRCAFRGGAPAKGQRADALHDVVSLPIRGCGIMNRRTRNRREIIRRAACRGQRVKTSVETGPRFLCHGRPRSTLQLVRRTRPRRRARRCCAATAASSPSFAVRSACRGKEAAEVYDTRAAIRRIKEAVECQQAHPSTTTERGCPSRSAPRSVRLRSRSFPCARAGLAAAAGDSRAPVQLLRAGGTDEMRPLHTQLDPKIALCRRFGGERKTRRLPCKLPVSVRATAGKPCRLASFTIASGRKR